MSNYYPKQFPRAGSGGADLSATRNDCQGQVEALAARLPVRGRPLMTVRAVISALDRTEESVLALIEDGELLWAWNLSLDARRETGRKDLRMLPECVDDYLAGRPCQLEWADVERLACPHAESVMKGPEIQRFLNCTETHLTHLINRRELTGKMGKRGRANATEILTFSFFNFLRRRRWPVPELD